MTDDQPTLPGMPPIPRQPYRRPSAASTVRYSKIATRTHRELCGDCTAEIHRLGQEFAPYPKRALWRRTDENGAVLLCQQHRDERVAHDAH